MSMLYGKYSLGGWFFLQDVYRDEYRKFEALNPYPEFSKLDTEKPDIDQIMAELRADEKFRDDFVEYLESLGIDTKAEMARAPGPSHTMADD